MTGMFYHGFIFLNHKHPQILIGVCRQFITAYYKTCKLTDQCKPKFLNIMSCLKARNFFSSKSGTKLAPGLQSDSLSTLAPLAFVQFSILLKHPLKALRSQDNAYNAYAQSFYHSPNKHKQTGPYLKKKKKKAMQRVLKGGVLQC